MEKQTTGKVTGFTVMVNDNQEVRPLRVFIDRFGLIQYKMDDAAPEILFDNEELIERLSKLSVSHVATVFQTAS
ncbi:hypothetical protein D3C81_1914090 [compost metagenome]